MAYRSNLVRAIRALVFSLCVYAVAKDHTVPLFPEISEQCVALADMPQTDVLWQISSAGGFYVYDMMHDSRKKFTSDRVLNFTCVEGQILINGSYTSSNKIYIVPVSCHAMYQDTAYEGAFGVECDETDALLYYYPVQKSTLHLAQGNASEEVDEPETSRETSAETERSSLYAVRVLLDEHTTREANSWILHASHGFLVNARQNPADQQLLADKTLKISYDAHSIYVNGKKWHARGIFIKPVSGLITYDGNNYQGTFSVRFFQDRLLLINVLDLEDYVYAVLCAESWPGWPLEFNKAMAIACRSYVIAMVMRMRTHAVPYHIKNTNVHQCYNGVQHFEVRKLAVEQTRGVFLTHDGKPIVAMFDACCGGVIPAKMHDVNARITPYLARDKKCNYCSNSKVYSWSVAHSLDHMAAVLKREYSRVKKVRDVQVTRVDKAGIVREVSFKTDRGTITISGKKMYALFKLRSFCYTIAKKDQKIVIKGRGYGHHKGLCQWGAREMVNQGWDYKSILQFYYPGVSFMRLPKG